MVSDLALVWLEPVEMNNQSVPAVVYFLHSISNVQQLLNHHKWATPRSIEFFGFSSWCLGKKDPHMISDFVRTAMYLLIV